MRSPKPLSASVPTAVWGAVACLVVVSAVLETLISGADVHARIEQLADERHEQTHLEHRLFWRTIAISAFVAGVVAARMLVG